MVRQKIITLLSGAVLLFGCAGGGPKVINLNKQNEQNRLVCDPFSVNKDEEITISIDFSSFSDDYNGYEDFAAIFFYTEVGEYQDIDPIFNVDGISSFKYNGDDLVLITNPLVAQNNNYMFYDDGRNKLSIAICHLNPNKDDKISIVAKANDKYENINVGIFHVAFGI